MCVCVRVCVCTSVRYTDTNTPHVHTYTCARARMHARTHACAHTHTHAQTHTHMRAHARARAHTRMTGKAGSSTSSASCGQPKAPQAREGGRNEAGGERTGKEDYESRYERFEAQAKTGICLRYEGLYLFVTVGARVCVCVSERASVPVCLRHGGVYLIVRVPSVLLSLLLLLVNVKGLTVHPPSAYHYP